MAISVDRSGGAGNGGGYMSGNTVLLTMWFKTDSGGPRVKNNFEMVALIPTTVLY